jgi:WhiB family redox-sensing transcriptional regulator
VTAKPRRSGGRHLARLVLPEGVDSRWQQEAACRTVHDPDLFFPGKSDTGEAAKQVCAGCPVLSQCLEFALATMPHPREDHGVYGGLLPAERARLRGGRLLIPASHVRSRAQAVIGRRLADHIGVAAAAHALGVTQAALTDSWRRRGLVRPPTEAVPRPVNKELYSDRAAAERALDLANRIGVVKAATALGVSHGTLYRAWRQHGLERPAPQPRGRPIGTRPVTNLEREEVADCGRP